MSFSLFFFNFKTTVQDKIMLYYILGIFQLSETRALFQIQYFHTDLETVMNSRKQDINWCYYFPVVKIWEREITHLPEQLTIATC